MRRPSVLKEVVACFDDAYLPKPPKRQLVGQKIPNEHDQIFARRGAVGEFRILVQIAVIEARHDPFHDKPIQLIDDRSACR